jgi:cytochrome c-type biogenesis protein CcsB
MILQTNLANYSFLALLGSMILYWIETSFTTIQSSIKESVLNSTYSDTENIQIKNKNKSLAKYGIVIANILLGLLLLLRWKESGHFPLSNLYESLMFLSWCFTVLHIYIDQTTLLPSSLAFFPANWENNANYKNKQQNPKENNEFIRKLFGAITTPSALLTNAFATFSLPKEMQEVSPLVPALQSNWLMMHVTVMILSYAALILGSLLSIAFLIITIDSPVLAIQNNSKYQSIALTLDNLSYRILGIGFPLLTIGILSGAVWANEAWGSYWSWDPKETWALLTWLIFAIYLHTRISKGWEGKKPAIIASFGFIIVWICYLGVNLIGEGLHSYGWIV